MAGFDVLKVDFLSKEEIAQLLKQYVQNRNNVLNSTQYKKEYRKLGLPSPTAVMNCFGSWGEAARAVGAETVYKKWEHFSDEELLSLLRSYFREFGRTPYQEEWDEHAKESNLPGKGVFHNRFLSWNNALRLASLPLSRLRRAKWNKETILEAINENKHLFPEIPTRKKYNKIKKGNKTLPSSTVIVRHYKSFYSLFILAGVSGEIPRAGRQSGKKI